MNNKITESRCSYEVCKLLKVKGFQVPTELYYTGDGKLNFKVEDSHGNEREYLFDYTDFFDNWNQRGLLIGKNDGIGFKHFSAYSCPTHAVAIKWIMENFRIMLFPAYNYHDGFHFGYEWTHFNGNCGSIWKDNDTDCSGCDTLDEATEYAITYTLQNLI